MGAHVFTIYDAEVRLYTVDAEGEIDAEQWIGTCADAIEIDPEFTELAVQYPGRARAKIRHIDETWRLALTNVRTIETGAGPPRLVQIRRNVEYALVIVWWDRDAQVWLKQCFFGVKGQPATLQGDNIRQRLRFTAEDSIVVAGTGGRPDLDLVRNGEVYYVDALGARTLFYTYDALARGFTAAAGQNDSLAEIVISGAGEVRITLGGADALVATSAGVEVGEIVAEGGTLLDDAPRLEFYTGNTRCCSLSYDFFVAPSIRETGTIPGASANVEFFNPGWLFSLTSARAVAPEFLERAA